MPYQGTLPIEHDSHFLFRNGQFLKPRPLPDLGETWLGLGKGHLSPGGGGGGRVVGIFRLSLEGNKTGSVHSSGQRGKRESKVTSVFLDCGRKLLLCGSPLACSCFLRGGGVPRARGEGTVVAVAGSPFLLPSAGGRGGAGSTAPPAGDRLHGHPQPLRSW